MNISKNLENNRLTVVGGGGHIGLPLSIIFANAGIEVICYDKNKNVIEQAAVIKGLNQDYWQTILLQDLKK